MTLFRKVTLTVWPQELRCKNLCKSPSRTPPSLTPVVRFSLCLLSLFTSPKSIWTSFTSCSSSNFKFLHSRVYSLTLSRRPTCLLCSPLSPSTMVLLVWQFRRKRFSSLLIFIRPFTVTEPVIQHQLEPLSSPSSPGRTGPEPRRGTGRGRGTSTVGDRYER